MRRILITGSNGYIGSSLLRALKKDKEYDVESITRQEVDLCKSTEVWNFFNTQDKVYDYIIHCAIGGGNRLVKDSYKVLDDNLQMYYNLIQYQGTHFNKFINFDSGASIFMGNTPYGLSKKVISSSISEKDECYNIRIFNVFDQNELDRRFIKASILRYIKKESILIHQNKQMDFFYMKDFISLVKYYLTNENCPKEVDCSYGDSFLLSDIAKIINNLDEHKVPIEIQSKRSAHHYCGHPNDLIDYMGIKEGIKEMYKELKIVAYELKTSYIN